MMTRTPRTDDKREVRCVACPCLFFYADYQALRPGAKIEIKCPKCGEMQVVVGR